MAWAIDLRVHSLTGLPETEPLVAIEVRPNLILFLFRQNPCFHASQDTHIIYKLCILSSKFYRSPHLAILNAVGPVPLSRQSMVHRLLVHGPL